MERRDFLKTATAVGVAAVSSATSVAQDTRRIGLR
jgi:hypothetical protein